MSRTERQLKQALAEVEALRADARQTNEFISILTNLNFEKQSALRELLAELPHRCSDSCGLPAAWRTTDTIYGPQFSCDAHRGRFFGRTPWVSVAPSLSLKMARVAVAATEMSVTKSMTAATMDIASLTEDERRLAAEATDIAQSGGAPTGDQIEALNRMQAGVLQLFLVELRDNGLSLRTKLAAGELLQAWQADADALPAPGGRS